jgi:hypothetical protein
MMVTTAAQPRVFATWQSRALLSLWNLLYGVLALPISQLLAITVGTVLDISVAPVQIVAAAIVAIGVLYAVARSWRVALKYQGRSLVICNTWRKTTVDRSAITFCKVGHFPWPYWGGIASAPIIILELGDRSTIRVEASVSTTLAPRIACRDFLRRARVQHTPGTAQLKG